jgi:hypothetical protein
MCHSATLEPETLASATPENPMLCGAGGSIHLASDCTDCSRPLIQRVNPGSDYLI